MGRGASRSKTGGMTVMKEADRKLFFNKRNRSMFGILQEGCFEKDFMSYCSNRLTGYCCNHWIDPDTVEQDNYILNTVMGISSINDSIGKTECYKDIHLQSHTLMIITQILLPGLLVMSLITSLLSIITFRHLCRLHIICHYLLYISVFDIIELLFCGSDMLLEAFIDLRLINTLQVISRSSCQILPFIFNLFKHCQCSLYVALSIDNWRFVRRPRITYCKFRREWIRNAVIVIVAVLATVNSQFFWTFDIAQNDNVVLHNRMIIKTFECGFSKTWPLQLGFTEYFWPIADHLAGELLPTVIPIYFGVRYLLNKVTYQPNLKSYIIRVDLLYQMNRAIAILTLIFGIITFPRATYFLLKYSIYYYYKSFRKSKAESSKFYVPFNLLTGNTGGNKGHSVINYENVLQLLEFIIKYTYIIFIIIKFVIVIKCVQLARHYSLSMVGLLRFFSSQSEQMEQGNIKTEQSTTVTKDDEDSGMITFKHRSASFRQPNEGTFHCSYNM